MAEASDDHPRDDRAVAPWDRPEPPGAFDLDESARRIGHYVWFQERLFEALGGWTVDTDEAAVQRRFDEHARQHAWHASLWRDRLPALRERPRDERCVPPNDAAVSFVHAVTESDAVAEPSGAGRTVDRLVGVYRVAVPHLLAAMLVHRSQASPTTDAPTLRTLALVEADLTAQWREGEALLRWLVTDPLGVEQAAVRQASLELALLQAGGVCGPGTLADPWAGPGRADS